MEHKHVPTLVYMKASLRRLPVMVHESNTDTDLTKSVHLHTGACGESAGLSIRKHADSREAEVIHYTCASTHSATHSYMYAFCMFSAA